MTYRIPWYRQAFWLGALIFAGYAIQSFSMRSTSNGSDGFGQCEAVERSQFEAFSSVRFGSPSGSQVLRHFVAASQDELAQLALRFATVHKRDVDEIKLRKRKIIALKEVAPGEYHVHYSALFDTKACRMPHSTRL